jgi:NDP-sugar pyrophosphorylase family protein
LQAVILAGGLGTRLWPLTREIPKPMAPVAGAPYLEHQLRLLKRQGIADILLLTGYLGDQIEEYFGEGERLGLSIAYSRETTPLGTGGALREAGPGLEDRFVLIYGDSFLPIAYADVLGALNGDHVEGVVVVCDNRLVDTSVPNNIAIDREGFIVRYDKDSPEDPGLSHVEAGVLAFRRSILDLIPPGVVSLEKEIFGRLILKRSLLSYTTTQRFYDIGTPERLRRIEAYLLNDYHSNTV